MDLTFLLLPLACYCENLTWNEKEFVSLRQPSYSDFIGVTILKCRLCQTHHHHTQQMGHNVNLQAVLQKRWAALNVLWHDYICQATHILVSQLKTFFFLIPFCPHLSHISIY